MAKSDHNPPSIHPILSDTEGCVTGVLMVVDGDVAELKQSIVGSLAEALPSVTMWVKSTRLSNADTRIGGVFDGDSNRKEFDIPRPILADYLKAGFHSEEELVGWLKSNLPYGPMFSLVKRYGADARIDGCDLSAIENLHERLEKALEFHREFPELHFSFDTHGHGVWEGQSNGVGLRIESQNPIISQVASQLRADLLNRFNVHINRTLLNWDVRFQIGGDIIKATRKIVLGDGKEEPEYSLSGGVKVWPQDQFIVRHDNSTCYIGIRDGAIDPSLNPARFREYCDKMFGGGNDFRWLSGINDPLTIEGGNMHVSGNIVFVGRDEVKYFSDTETPNWDKAAMAIRCKVFGTTVGNHLVWIGLTEKGSDLRNNKDGFQPAYHTDVFFQPLGFLADKQGNVKFRYIYAAPDRKSTFPPVHGALPSSLKNLFSRFKRTLADIEAQLKPIVGFSEPILIPLPIQFNDDNFGPQRPMNWEDPKAKAKIEECWAFANGIVDMQPNKGVNYLMPVYLKGSSTPRKIKSVQRKVVEKLEKSIASFKVVTISGNELGTRDMAGLRCNVKVVSRRFIVAAS